MATDTSVCNQALDALGKPRLTTLGVDGSFEDNLCVTAYPEVRDEVLRIHPWNVGVKRAILAENLLLQSAAFDNASWTKTNATATADVLRAPFGSTQGQSIDDSDAGNAGTVVQAVTVPNDSKNHTFSIYIKDGTAAETRFLLAYSVGSGVSQAVVVTWGSTPSIDAGTIEEIGDGWWRLKITLANNGTGNTTLTMTIQPAGATASATGLFFAFGAQITQTEGAVGYSETTTAASLAIFPTFGYNFGFPLPTDFLALIDVNDGDLHYKLEDGHLLYDSTDAPIRYQYQETDADKLDPLLQTIIGLRLAVRLSIPLTGSVERLALIDERLLKAEGIATSRDAKEDGEDPPIEDPWIEARFGRGGTSVGRWPIGGFR